MQPRNIFEEELCGVVRALGFERWNQVHHPGGAIRDRQNSVVQTAVTREFRKTDNPINTDELSFARR